MPSDRDLFLFVSHVAEDRAAALEIVEELERRGTRCWIAPRDIHAGRPFDDEIVDAIEASRALLLVFSDRCNESEYIRREVTVAGESHKLIIPFRIEDAQPKRGLRVRLGDLHMIDGFVSREQAVDEVLRTCDLPRSDRSANSSQQSKLSKYQIKVILSYSNLFIVCGSLFVLALVGTATIEKIESFSPAQSTAQLVPQMPVKTLIGHSDDVNSLVFLSDGKSLASASDDRTIKIWNTENGRCDRTLTGHDAGVASIAISPDGRMLASGSDDKTIKLWNAGTGALVRTLTGHTGEIEFVAFSRVAGALASASDDTTIGLWDIENGQMIRVLKGHKERVETVAFSPDGQILASGSDDKTIKLWNAETGQLLETLSGHTQKIAWVAFSPDGRFLASASDDKTVRLWNVATRDVVRTLTAHRGAVETVAFSPDGRILASAGDDQTVRIWDWSSGRLLRTLQGHSNSVMAVAFSPDGRALASGGKDKTIMLWDVTTVMTAYQ